MSPVEHYRRAFRVGLLALFTGVVGVAWAFFGRAPSGQLRLASWAGRLGDAGLNGQVAHFLLWGSAVTFLGGCFAVAMAVFCRLVPAACPACGGAAYWQSKDTVAYVCRACGNRHDTGLGWGGD
jgi:hypothetical protein